MIQKQNKSKLYFITTVDLTKYNGERTHIMELVNNLSFYFKITLFVADVSSETIEKLKKAKITIKKIYATKMHFKYINKLKIIPLLMKEVIKNKPSIVYIRGNIYISVLTPFLRLLKINIVTEINGIMEKELKLRKFSSFIITICCFLENIALKNSIHIICVSEGIKEELIKKYNIDPHKIYVIPNGVNIDLFKPIDKNMAFCKTGLNPKWKYIGFVGNLAPWQRLDIIFKAFSKLLKKEKDIRLIIIGDGESKLFLIKEADRLGLNKFVIFKGEIKYESIPNYINVFSLGIVPDQRIEKGKMMFFPLKLFEYLNCGIPVIIPKNQELTFIEESKVGLLVDFNNIIELIKGMEKLIKSEVRFDKSKALNLAKEYSWEKIAAKTANILKR